LIGVGIAPRVGVCKSVSVLRTLVVWIPLLFALGCSGPVVLKAKSVATLRSGAPISEISGVDHRGREFSLEAALAKGPVVVIFYRGHW
jgi:hypothetical protein